MCLGSLRNGGIDESGIKPIVSYSGINTLLQRGQLLEPIFITFPIIGNKRKRLNPEL